MFDNTLFINIVVV